MKNNIEEIFQKENFIIPNYNNINIVDLIQTIINNIEVKNIIKISITTPLW